MCPRISGDAQEDGESDQLDLDDEGNEVPVKRALAAVGMKAPRTIEWRGEPPA